MPYTLYANYVKDISFLPISNYFTKQSTIAVHCETGNSLISLNNLPNTSMPLARFFLLFLLLIFSTPAITNNAFANTIPMKDHCSAFVPIEVSKLAALCKNRLFSNLQEYRHYYFDGKWTIHIDYCERAEIKYLTYKFLPPNHAKKFNEKLNKIMELQSELFMKFDCGDQSCGSSLGNRTSSYVIESVRTILYAVVEELNDRIRRERCQ